MTPADYRALAEWAEKNGPWMEGLVGDPQAMYRIARALERAAVLEEAAEVLKGYVNYKPFGWRFNHTGAMNATQLAERDGFLVLESHAKDVLARLSSPPESEA